MPTTQLLTQNELAHALGIDRKTLAVHVLPCVPAVKCGPRSWRYDLKECLRALRTSPDSRKRQRALDRELAVAKLDQKIDATKQHLQELHDEHRGREEVLVTAQQLRRLLQERNELQGGATSNVQE